MNRHVERLAGRVLALLAVSIVLEIIAQLLPPHYSAIRDTESALAVGPYRALEITSFCVRGLLVFVLLRAGSLAIPPEFTARLGNRMLMWVAMSKFVIAFVPTDLAPRPETLHGLIHAVVAFASFFAASIGEVLVSRKLLDLPWIPGHLLLRLAQITVAWSILITVTAGMGLACWGLLERIETVLLLGWIAIFAEALRIHARGRVWR
ncbi:MAG: DUF998 domain-containing protein [Kofleriaceae bacterium]